MPKADVRKHKPNWNSSNDWNFDWLVFLAFSRLLHVQSKTREVFNNFISGSIGGCLGTMVNTPCKFFFVRASIRFSHKDWVIEWKRRMTHCAFVCFNYTMSSTVDVVKSRIQNAVVLPGERPKYGWTYPAIATIAKEEGVAALYKGFIPKVSILFFPVAFNPEHVCDSAKQINNHLGIEVGSRRRCATSSSRGRDWIFQETARPALRGLKSPFMAYLSF